MRVLQTLLVYCCVIAAAAQNTGTLRMLVDPGHNFSFVVDKKHRMQQREIKLSEGLHHFSIWAPERMIVDTNVFVVAGRTSDFVLQLPYSPEYVSYRTALGRYETRKRVARSLPSIATAGSLIWTGVAFGKYQKARDVLKVDEETYTIEVDPASIRTLKEETIPAHNQDLRKARVGLYSAIGATALTGAITYYLFKRSASWERPTMEDKQKVIFDGLVWSPGEKGGMLHVGLSIPLAR